MRPKEPIVLIIRRAMSLAPCARGKAEKYPLSDARLHGCRAKYYSIWLFMAALP